ncbi:unnamed protein product [Microthlaspi erraticum]|uniref:NAC domain-containing protein n=1 Tax=Microthlaspi erraticum TaxID=1685480 RepID=A0A6D2JM73_9BRAS|nr:unnamed protein product [Microthlaspi erraticum]
MVYPIGAKFNPTDLGLVRLYLRNKVENKQSRFIIPTLNVYEAEPCHLRHVSNSLFKEKEWYYFVERTKRRGTTVNRTVPGKGESEGGTWKSTAKKTKIVDGDDKVIGYKQSLVFNKKVKGKPVKTDWLMTEFSLHKEGVEFQNWVLCWIRDRQKKDEKLNLVPQVENNNNNIVLPDQEQQEDDFSNQLEMMLMKEEEHGDATQQQEEDTPIPPHPPLQSNDSNNFMMMSNLVPQVENNNNIVLPDQEQEEDDFGNQLEKMMIEEEYGDVTRQQEEDTPIPHPSPLQSNDSNNFMMMSNQEQDPCNGFGFDGDDENEYIGYDRLMQIMDEPIEATLTQQEQRSEDRLQLHQPIPIAQGPGVYAGQDDMMMMTNNYGYMDVTASLENQ